MPELFVIWAQLDFGTRASPKQSAGFLPSRSESKASYLCWNNSFKIIAFGVEWILLGENCQEILLVLTCQNIQRHNSPALLVSFLYQGVN